MAKKSRKASSRPRRTSTRLAGTRARKAAASRPARRRAAAGGTRKAAAKSRKTARTKTARKKTAPKKTARSARPGSTRTRTPARSNKQAVSRKRATRAASAKKKTTPRKTPAAPGTGSARRAPHLDRKRRTLRELDEGVPTPPSSLNLDRLPSAARSGRQRLRSEREEHTEASPVLTGGDVDADWQDAYAVGDEAPGGDNPTPDQDRVDDIGKALGVTYDDNEELKASDKIADRDRHRWELDPASSEDYRERK